MVLMDDTCDPDAPAPHFSCADSSLESVLAYLHRVTRGGSPVPQSMRCWKIAFRNTPKPLEEFFWNQQWLDPNAGDVVAFLDRANRSAISC